MECPTATSGADHLIYLFSGLLPALRDAMPRIVEMVERPVSATDSPSTDLPLVPAPGPSTHSQGQIPNKAGTVEASGPAADTGDKPASSPASADEIADGAAMKRRGATKRARPAKPRKPAAVPRAQPQQTDETATA